MRRLRYYAPVSFASAIEACPSGKRRCERTDCEAEPLRQTAYASAIGWPAFRKTLERASAVGRYTSVTRYKDTSGSSADEVMTSTFQYDTLQRLTGLDYENAAGTDIVTPFAWSYDNLSTPGYA